MEVKVLEVTVILLFKLLIKLLLLTLLYSVSVTQTQQGYLRPFGSPQTHITHHQKLRNPIYDHLYGLAPYLRPFYWSVRPLRALDILGREISRGGRGESR